MKATLVLVHVLALVSLIAARSTGCGKAHPHAYGKSKNHNITMHDPATDEEVTRSYHVNLPAGYKPGHQHPVVFWFHGWGDDPTYFPFVDIGQQHQVISVYPLGMDDEDVEPGQGRISWNVGDANSTSTCTSMTESACYKSCKKLKACSRCNCFTCIDDVHFVKTLIAQIEEDFCVDESRLYLAGASNGGMFTYYLVSQIPELVNGWLLMFGQPMVGYLNTPKAAAQSYLLSLHGRQDTCLPPAGGIDGDDSWIYESLDNTFYLWGLVQGCDISSWQRTKTPFDDVKGNKHLICHEYTRGCREGRAMSCMYHGVHGDIPDYMPAFGWWFWNTRYGQEMTPLSSGNEFL